jgi:hypothetical protein
LNGKAYHVSQQSASALCFFSALANVSSNSIIITGPQYHHIHNYDHHHNATTTHAATTLRMTALPERTARAAI